MNNRLRKEEKSYTRHWLRKLGATMPVHLPNPGTQHRKILDLMADGEWHSNSEIRNLVEGSEHTRTLRRLRDIKGLRVIKRKTLDGKEFEYKWEQENE